MLAGSVKKCDLITLSVVNGDCVHRMRHLISETEYHRFYIAQLPLVLNGYSRQLNDISPHQSLTHYWRDEK
jgi:hypothetical protein